MRVLDDVSVFFFFFEGSSSQWIHFYRWTSLVVFIRSEVVDRPSWIGIALDKGT